MERDGGDLRSHSRGEGGDGGWERPLFIDEGMMRDGWPPVDVSDGTERQLDNKWAGTILLGLPFLHFACSCLLISYLSFIGIDASQEAH